MFLGLVKKVFWGILVFGCFGALITHITIIAIQYGSYKVSASVQITSERELPFPSVTFCNMNPLKKSALSKPGLPDTLVNTGTSRKKRAAQTRDKHPDDKHIENGVCELKRLIQIDGHNNCKEIKKINTAANFNKKHNIFGKGFGKRPRKKRASKKVIKFMNTEKK